MHSPSTINFITETFAHRLPVRALHTACETLQVTLHDADACGVNDQTIHVLLSERGVQVFSIVRHALGELLAHDSSADLFDHANTQWQGNDNPLVTEVHDILQASMLR